jgi:hypothetical protein
MLCKEQTSIVSRPSSSPCLEVVDHVPPVHNARGAIQAQILELAEVEVVLQDVHHARHLSKDEHPVALPAQAPQQTVQGLELARVLEEE